MLSTSTRFQTASQKPDEQKNARELRIARFLMVSHSAATA